MAGSSWASQLNQKEVIIRRSFWLLVIVLSKVAAFYVTARSILGKTSIFSSHKLLLAQLNTTSQHQWHLILFLWKMPKNQHRVAWRSFHYINSIGAFVTRNRVLLSFQRPTCMIFFRLKNLRIKMIPELVSGAIWQNYNVATQNVSLIFHFALQITLHFHWPCMRYLKSRLAC